MEGLKVEKKEPKSFQHYNIGAFSLCDPQSRPFVEDKNTITRTRANLIHNVTVEIVQTYKLCNKNFKAVEAYPQRVLTNPAEGVLNNGLDNSEGNLVCRVHDKLQNGNHFYTILDLVGTGTFGQVFRCKRDDTKELVAVKVIKNKPAYYNQGILEIKIAKLLNSNYDPNNEKHIVRLIETFEYKGHICIVFELLGMSLLDLLTQNQFRGLPLSAVQKFTKQILTSLAALEDANVIHCDLKPENILVVPPTTVRRRDREKKDGVEATSPHEPSSRRPGVNSDIKVIDFGSACFEGRTIYSYIQSRFYRSPEVLLGAAYTGAIDLWSLGCVCAEMYLGLPLFPGVSQHNQLSRIVEMLGVPPDFLVECKNGLKYFTLVNPAASSNEPVKSTLQQAQQTHSGKYRIKTAEEYAHETSTEVPVLKKYLRYNTLDEVIMKCSLPNKSRLTQDQKNSEMLRRKCFVDFLHGLFRLNPFERWTAKQALEHPFVKNTPFTAPFQPPPDLKMQERKLMFMVQMQQRQTSEQQHQQQQQNVGLKAQRAPTNFGSTGAQPVFTPLNYAHRRLSDPIDSATTAAKAAFFENNDRPLLKRGDPVHLKDQAKAVPVPAPAPAPAPSTEPTPTETVQVAVTEPVLEKVAKLTLEETQPSELKDVASAESSPDKVVKALDSPAIASLGEGASSVDISKEDDSKVDQRVPKPNPSMTKNKPRHSFTAPSKSEVWKEAAPVQAAPVQERKRSNSIRGQQQGQSQQPQSSSQNWVQPQQHQQQQQQQQPPQLYPPNQYDQPPPFPGSLPLPHHLPPVGFPVPPQWPGVGFPPPPMNMIPGMMPPPPQGMFPPMASSFGPSSYGVFAGSMQEGHFVMTDFGMALLRPDMDEQRRLLSQNNPPPMWSQGPPPPNMMVGPRGELIDPMFMHHPPQMPGMPPHPFAYSPASSNPMIPPNHAMPMAMSYDSKMLPRMASNRMHYDPQQQQNRSNVNNNNPNNNPSSANNNPNITRTIQQQVQQHYTPSMRSPNKKYDPQDGGRSFSQDNNDGSNNSLSRSFHGNQQVPSSVTTVESSYQSRNSDDHPNQAAAAMMRRSQQQPQHHSTDMDSDDSYHNKQPISSPSTNHKHIPPPPSMTTPPNIAPPQRNNSNDQTNNKTKAKSPGNKNRRVDALADWDPFFESDD